MLHYRTIPVLPSVHSALMFGALSSPTNPKAGSKPYFLSLSENFDLNLPKKLLRFLVVLSWAAELLEAALTGGESKVLLKVPDFVGTGLAFTGVVAAGAPLVTSAAPLA